MPDEISHKKKMTDLLKEVRNCRCSQPRASLYGKEKTEKKTTAKRVRFHRDKDRNKKKEQKD